jgi:hypothetical protein
MGMENWAGLGCTALWKPGNIGAAEGLGHRDVTGQCAYINRVNRRAAWKYFGVGKQSDAGIETSDVASCIHHVNSQKNTVNSAVT